MPTLGKIVAIIRWHRAGFFEEEASINDEERLRVYL
jgi:hypothetical protein